MNVVGAGPSRIRDALAHELFELWAHSTPDATALRFCERTLSYAQLNTKANRLAHHLKACGVGLDSRVVVCVEPGFEIMTALLALLKLGAVYVPLDPSHPPARLQLMLDETRPAMIVTLSELRDRLPSSQLPVLELDTDERLIERPGRDLDIAIEPSQTAYIYYTSGTTGTPKGILASHANLAHYLGSARRRYRFQASDVGVAIARFTFSISMFELMSPLTSGGSLLLLPRAHVLDPARLCEALRGATFFHAGPSLLRGLLDHIKRHYADFSAFDRVRHASSGGDTVPVGVLDDLRAIFRNAEIFVIYGCSEISCMGTTFEVPRGERLERTYVGQPFEGSVLRVLTDDSSEAPPGVVGEVSFAGPGVVKGYLNRPELTAEKFFERDGLRFYRTGDRGKLSQQGLLELVGRSDFQVKIAGIRIELGEIEHHLRGAPQVANGVVSAVDRDGEKTLLAYWVPQPGATGDSSDRARAIRRYLADRLPDYMVPRSFIELHALPLNHNMKVDRRALPPPPREAVRPAGASDLRPPQSATERRLAELWCAVLGIDRVGLDDNFFDLGGTSALALRLVQAVDRELTVTLSGLEVLREPLGVQAELCVLRSGGSVDKGDDRVLRADASSFEAFDFGPERSLYGVLHGADLNDADTAVLICAPLGHESVRAHFVLNRLARRLAASQYPTLRFDYYGCLDSRGDGSEASCTRWQEDILAARRELLRRTGARHVIAVGARLGATLLANVARTAPFSKLVLWDPVEQGAAHLADLRRAHRRVLRASPLFSLGARLNAWLGLGQPELLGSSYSQSTLRELAQLVLPSPPQCSCPTERLHTDCGWLELAKLEDMLPDAGISRQLAELVQGPP